MVDSTNYVNVHGPVSVGTCTYTKSGKLKAQGIKYVIHAVGPEFKKDACVLHQQMLLFNAVYNSLVIANKLGCRSISIPAISSGIFGFPRPLCAQIIFSAINSFIRDKLKEGFGS